MKPRPFHLRRLQWSRRARPSRLLALSMLALPFVSGFLCAQQHPTDQQVKAAYLFNFGKFVTWEASETASADPVEMCVLGKDPFGIILDTAVAGESIDGKKISVKRLDHLQEATHCRILFVAASEENHLASIVSMAQRQGTLTVSDIPHFAEQGGVIGFVTLQDKTRFEVNRKAAEDSHLILSSQLLKVASRVIDKNTPRGRP